MKEVLPFNLLQLPTSATVVLIGKRFSGKTTTIMNIMHHFMNIFEFGYVICASNATREIYRDSIPNAFIHAGISADMIERIVSYQEMRSKKGNIKPIFIIFDDLNFDQKLLRSTSMFKLFANGRHYKIFLLLSLQYLKGIGPNCRGNIDAVILHRETVLKNQKKLFDDYACGFKTFDEFRHVFDEVAKERRVLIMMKCEEQKHDFPVFNWKPHYPIPKFKINSKGEWWNPCSSIEKQILNIDINTPYKDENNNNNLNKYYNNCMIDGSGDKKSLLITVQPSQRRIPNTSYRLFESTRNLQQPRTNETNNKNNNNTNNSQIIRNPERHAVLVNRISEICKNNNDISNMIMNNNNNIIPPPTIQPRKNSVASVNVNLFSTPSTTSSFNIKPPRNLSQMYTHLHKLLN